MMVNRLQQNMKQSCIKHPRHGINMIGIEQLVKQPQGQRQSSRKPFHQQVGQGQKLSTQRVNLQGWIGTAPVQPPPPPKPVNPWDVQPQALFHPLTATRMTSGYPPRPPIKALPKPMPEVMSQATHKHPLPQPAQQGPPNKQVRHKAFPQDQQPSATASMASPSAVDMLRRGNPSPKGPPASFMPTPGDVHRMLSSSPAVDPEDISDRTQIQESAVSI